MMPIHIPWCSLIYDIITISRLMIAFKIVTGFLISNSSTHILLRYYIFELSLFILYSILKILNIIWTLFDHVVFWLIYRLIIINTKETCTFIILHDAKLHVTYCNISGFRHTFKTKWWPISMQFFQL